ncbi:MAG: hypothetical protein ABGZ35_13610, partial [Planctomycetaceae bacterium]
IRREPNTKDTITKPEARYVADHSPHSHHLANAAAYYRQSDDAERLLECLRQVSKGGNNSVFADVLSIVFETLIDAGEWSLLVSLVTHGEPRQGSRNRWEKPERLAVVKQIKEDNCLLRLVIPRLAASEKLAAADVKSKNDVSELLANTVLRRQAVARWWNTLPWMVAGAAIERAGKDIDALEFYEKWRDSKPRTKDRNYAERRWVVCKLRQSKREETNGNARKAGLYRHAAEEVMEKHRWTARDVVNVFPDITPADASGGHIRKSTTDNQPQQMPQKPTTTSDNRIGTVSFRVFPAKGWVNLQSDEGTCARIFLSDRRVTSDEVIFESKNDSMFRCEEWGLTVSWPSKSSISLVHKEETRVIEF